MAYKTLIFGTDALYPKLKPFYDAEVKRGNLEIVACIDDTSRVGGGENVFNFDLAIISSKKLFYKRMKMLEKIGFPSSKIIDGAVFMVPNLDFSRLIIEGIAYGILEKAVFKLCIQTIYPQVYTMKDKLIKLSMGMKSYINSAKIEGKGEVSIKKFCPIARNIVFELGRNADHNYKNVSSAPAWYFSLNGRRESKFMPPQGTCKILIGNDVWIGRGCILKCTNPNKPLVIGDGAVIASDSVVVKNVPPYAIVGGNPAQIIKYRFPPDVIEALLRIKWWDWNLDKIHDNFKYFNDIDKFISLHDETYSTMKNLSQYVAKIIGS